MLAAVRGIADALEPGTVVALKSATPVGTAARVQAEIRRRTRQPVEVASNPEFLREGTAVDDFLRPDRVVIGADSDRAREALTELHRSFTPAATPILAMDVASAEIAKQAANAMLAARVSLMNSVAGLCDAAGADVEQVRRAVGADRRIGTAFLAPGVGYGGSCLPKDVQAFAHALAEHGVDDALPRAVTRVNERQRNLPLQRIIARLGADLAGRFVAVWGLAFKPGTDDLREAPSLVTVRGVLERGARVSAHDPAAMDAARRLLGDQDRLQFAPDPYAALDGADALAIHTEWDAYRDPDFGRMRAALATPLIVDGRNLYDPTAMREEGFDYLPVGRTAPERG